MLYSVAQKRFKFCLGKSSPFETWNSGLDRRNLLSRHPLRFFSPWRRELSCLCFHMQIGKSCRASTSSPPPPFHSQNGKSARAEKRKEFFYESIFVTPSMLVLISTFAPNFCLHPPSAPNTNSKSLLRFNNFLHLVFLYIFFRYIMSITQCYRYLLSNAFFPYLKTTLVKSMGL